MNCINNEAGGAPLSIIGVPAIIRPALQERFTSHFLKNNRDNNPKPCRHFLWMDFNTTNLNYRRKVIHQTLKEIKKLLFEIMHGASKDATLPSHVSLIYVPPLEVTDHRTLLEYFCGFARCMPVRTGYEELLTLPKFRQADTFIDTISRMNTFSKFQSAAVSYLPLRNFICKDNNSLRANCVERILSSPELFPIDDKWMIIKKCRDERGCVKCQKTAPPPKKVPVDVRNLCFVNGAPHGMYHDLPSDIEKPLVALESFYRFGWPIKPGTQCDVQKPKDRTLGGISFNCQRYGIVPDKICKKTDHANIYCNDTINIIGWNPEEVDKDI